MVYNDDSSEISLEHRDGEKLQELKDVDNGKSLRQKRQQDLAMESARDSTVGKLRKLTVVGTCPI